MEKPKKEVLKEPRSWKSIRTRMRRYWVLYVMLLLPIAYFIIFRYAPMPNLVMAFKQNNIIKPIWEVPWVGFANFEKAFANRDFWLALRNTVMLNLLDLGIGFPAPIILAIILNELIFIKFKRFTQTVAYMPHFLSWVIIYGLAMRLFGSSDGLVNVLLSKWGFAPLEFFSKSFNWVVTYVFLGIWQSVGWNTIIYLAAITSINPELYEAATVDGASRIEKIIHITLPCLRPTIVVLLILTLGGLLGSSFDRPYVLGNNLVYDVSNVLSVWIYRLGILGMQFSMTTAVGLFQSVIGICFVLTANWFARKIGERGLW